MIETELVNEIIGNYEKYQKSLMVYNEAEQVEQQAEQQALQIINVKHNTNYIDSCNFVNNSELFSEFLEYKQKQLRYKGIENPLNSVYSWQFKKELLKNEKMYLLSFLKILKENGNEQAYNEFCELLTSGKMLLTAKQKLLDFANNMIEQLNNIKENKKDDIL
jgi:hypothetical protein